MRNWHLADKMAALASLIIVAWLAFPSSLFIRHHETKVSDSVVVFTRDVPFSVNGDLWSEIRLQNGHECSSPEKREYFQGYVSYSSYRLGAWADDCLQAGTSYTLTTHRRVLLGGFIPLRPSRDVLPVVVSQD